MSKTIRDYLDNIKLRGGYGAITKGAVNVLKGPNHRGGGNIAPANKDNQGYVFVTKPNLNLSYYNLMQARRLSFLANSDPTSMATALRCMLSPQVEDNWGMTTMPRRGTGTDVHDLPRSQIIDDRYAFIPLISNTLVSLSGWPDFVAEIASSKEGLRKETVSWIDSVSDIYSSYDLNATFQNISGNPVLALMAAWVEYSTRVAVGSMDPYARMIVENEIDYQTRIYRFTLDPTKRYIREVAEACVCFPTAVPIGASFNYSVDNIFTADTEQVSFRFSCTGARYNDPISIYNFNRIVETFNPSMRIQRRGTEMRLLTHNEVAAFNYMGYPRVSDNYELEWWVTNEDYAKIMERLNVPTDITVGGLDSLGVNPSTVK